LVRYMGAPIWLPPPRRSSRPGQAVALLCFSFATWGPRYGSHPPDVRRAPAKPWRSSASRSLHGGPDMAPTPQTFVAPRPSRGAPLLLVPYMWAPIWLPPPRRTSRPGQAVALLCFSFATWGPRYGSHPPDVRRAPAKPWRSSASRSLHGGPDMAPTPQTFVAPRPSRGAPLLLVPYMWAPIWLPPPRRTSRPGQAVALLCFSFATWGPRYGSHPPDVRRAPAKPWRSSASRSLHGGPDMAPTPQTFVAPRPSRGAPLLLVPYMWAPIWLPPPRRTSRPGQAVALLCFSFATWGPRYGSHPPDVRRAPAKPWRSSASRSLHGGPDMAPTPQTFVAPRPSRGAPLLLVRYMGAPIWLPPPRRSSRPGQAEALLCFSFPTCGPRYGSHPPDVRRAPAKPWRSSASRSLHGGPDMAPTPQTFVAPRPSRGAPLLLVRYMGAPTWLPPPRRSSRPGQAGAL